MDPRDPSPLLAIEKEVESFQRHTPFPNKPTLKFLLYNKIVSKSFGPSYYFFQSQLFFLLQPAVVTMTEDRSGSRMVSATSIEHYIVEKVCSDWLYRGEEKNLEMES